MDKRTKIIATISDKRCEVEFIRSLYEAGMNAVRINTAHVTTRSAATVSYTHLTLPTICSV